MILQENEILFPSNRRLEEFVEQISDETEHLVSLGRAAAKSQEMYCAVFFLLDGILLIIIPIAGIVLLVLGCSAGIYPAYRV